MGHQTLGALLGPLASLTSSRARESSGTNPGALPVCKSGGIGYHACSVGPRETITVIRKRLLFLCFALALMPASQASAHWVSYGNPDHYVYVPALPWPHARHDVSCDEARALLEHKHFHVSKTIRCGGAYHVFSAQRRGFAYIVHVMTGQGQDMVDDRSR